MTDEEKAAQAAEAAKKEAEAQAAAAAKAKEKPADDAATLKALLDKERAERQAANAEAQKHRKRLRELEEEKKKAEEAVLSEQGKHKELAEARAKELEATRTELEQLRALKAQKDAEEASARAARETQVATEFAQLPENVRAAIPADADLRSKEIAINTHRATTGARAPLPVPTAPRPASGPANDAPPEPTDAEQQALGNPNTPPEKKREIRTKLERWNAWQHEK